MYKTQPGGKNYNEIGVLSGDTNNVCVGDRIGAASVQFMVSKDDSNSHEDFGQINLKISN